MPSPAPGRSADARASGPAVSPNEATTARVVQSFNTWAFKRCQPTEPERLRAAVADAIGRDGPIPFVLYWGKGPRATVAAPELAALAFLQQMADRIETAHAPGASITLILTDTHAHHNGHPPAGIAAYFAAVARAGAAYGFATCRLSDLVATEATAAGAPDDAADAPRAAMRRRLEACAAKWYRGSGDIETGAADYYRMNMVERSAVERAFPAAIFITYNGPDYRDLFPPALPVFYMYSMRKGVAVKPWFAAADDEAETATLVAPAHVGLAHAVQT